MPSAAFLPPAPLSCMGKKRSCMILAPTMRSANRSCAPPPPAPSRPSSSINLVISRMRGRGGCDHEYQWNRADREDQRTNGDCGGLPCWIAGGRDAAQGGLHRPLDADRG